jgi:hypothetical protein
MSGYNARALLIRSHAKPLAVRAGPTRSLSPSAQDYICVRRAGHFQSLISARSMPFSFA